MGRGEAVRSASDLLDREPYRTIWQVGLDRWQKQQFLDVTEEDEEELNDSWPSDMTSWFPPKLARQELAKDDQEYSRQRIHQAFQKMVDEGLLRKLDRGEYEITHKSLVAVPWGDLLERMHDSDFSDRADYLRRFRDTVDRSDGSFTGQVDPLGHIVTHDEELDAAELEEDEGLRNIFEEFRRAMEAHLSAGYSEDPAEVPGATVILRVGPRGSLTLTMELDEP